MGGAGVKASGGAAALADYLAHQDRKQMLRFLTCGSVDDGKSTLIGRLLYDTKLIFEDQLATLERDSKKHGTTGEGLDFALLVDGLEAEREQGITIDVAYRFFATPKRKFIVADAPGHEQYTRNMATAASTADLAVVLIDARQGVLRQTRRHAFIASLLGIRHLVLAVNKMDLLGFRQDVFDGIVSDFRGFADGLSFQSITPVPMSARHGDNVSFRSARTNWYSGPALLEHLETIPIDDTRRLEAPLRFPVQYVSRPNADFRGFAGTVAAGWVAPGQAVTAAKSGRSTRVKRIATLDCDLELAQEGQAVTLVLEDEIDISRGDILAAPEARPHLADQFAAHLVWFDEHPLLPGRDYLLRTETDQTTASVTELRHRVDVDTFAHEAVKALAMNEIGLCNLSTQSPIAFDAYAENRSTGGFVLIDRFSNATVGAGMILHPLRRATNLHWQAIDVDRAARAALKRQRPAVLWFTGLSGSGKSTIANLVEKRLHARGLHTILLDGDNVRHGLNRDLGFTEADRVENIRRVAEVAKLMTDAGLVALVSFISPFRAERQMARERMAQGEFIEIFVDTPLEECVRRDPKGLYARALKGEIKNFTGIDSPYEPPAAAELHLATKGRSAEELAEQVEAYLRAHGHF
ncbi:MAG TPA: sulfate adenylyltransferase subunit CysN [Mesorhizobium sp.]|jgi:bifunctional enzyme CysN/CysC|nr:sulfate adenylyltransferase subunit CysN [Mesorhizobium sp.]